MKQTLEELTEGMQARKDAALETTDYELINRLNSFNAPYLEEKLMKRNVFPNKDEYNTAFIEFKKYAALCVIHGRQIPMKSKAVDEVWHQFILFTPHYAKFCDDYLGKFLHHIPSTSLTPMPEGITPINFSSAYESTFGKIPLIWENSSWSCTNGGTDDCVDTTER